VRTENDVQNMCRLRAQELGAVLWRNNNGALPNPAGVPVRFGLANDSKNVNRVFKSSDLIGMTSRPGVSRSHLVRVPFGLMFAVECKEPAWRWAATEEEIAQLNYIRFVRDAGGIAGFANHPDNVTDLLGGGHGYPIAQAYA
jgi:hypothetical protein